MYWKMTDVDKWARFEKITYQNKLYFVIFKVQMTPNITDEKIKELKKEGGFDIVLRAGNNLYFCQEIEDAEIIQEFNQS